MNRQTFKLDIKSVDDETGVFNGYCAVFGNIDSYDEIIEPGAFTKTLKERPTIPILWQHDTDKPIGVTEDVIEDDHGLLVKGRLNLAVQQGREAYELVKQGALSGLSIGFKTIKDKFEGKIRHLKEIKLYEYSLVTFPANELAGVTSIKSMQEIDTAINRIMEASAERPELVGKAVEYLTALVQDEPSHDTPSEAQSQSDIKSQIDISHLIDNLKALNNTLGVK